MIANYNGQACVLKHTVKLLRIGGVVLLLRRFLTNHLTSSGNAFA